MTRAPVAPFAEWAAVWHSRAAAAESPEAAKECARKARWCEEEAGLRGPSGWPRGPLRHGKVSAAGAEEE